MSKTPMELLAEQLEAEAVKLDAEAATAETELRTRERIAAASERIVNRRTEAALLKFERDGEEAVKRGARAWRYEVFAFGAGQQYATVIFRNPTREEHKALADAGNLPEAEQDRAAKLAVAKTALWWSAMGERVTPADFVEWLGGREANGNLLVWTRFLAAWNEHLDTTRAFSRGKA